MMPAAKHFDPVLGIDIHIIQPPGPVPPLPIPHPFIGLIMDPFDYVPIIGATIFVGPIPRAVAGTAGYAVPPHFPIGGMFVKIPGNECEIFMGSSTVLMDQEPASYLGLPVLSCHDIGMMPPVRAKPKKTYSLVLPTSVVLPIPMPVFVGGPPTISLTALAFRVGISALGKAFKKLKKLKKFKNAVKRVSDKAHKAANKVMDALKVTKKARNKVHRSICKVTGHPVDIATGKVFTESLDFILKGVIPIVFERVWFSTSDYDGPLGYGWHHRYDMALAQEDGVACVRLADGRGAMFEDVAEGAFSLNPQEGLSLRKQGGVYLLSDGEFEYIFSQPDEAGAHLLTTISDRRLNRLDLSYDLDRSLVEISRNTSGFLRFENDGQGRITRVIAPHHQQANQSLDVLTFAYSSQGDLTTVWDAARVPFKYEYQNHLLTTETTRIGMRYYFEYDGDNSEAHCIRTWGEGNFYSRYLHYDLANRQTMVTNSLGYVITCDWNDLGLVTRIVDAEGREETYEYDDQNRLIKETDVHGLEATYDFDSNGNPATIEDGPVSIKAGWDSLGNPTDVSSTTVTESYEYDPTGAITLVRNPLGAEYRISNGSQGQPTRIDWAGQGQDRFEYDADGNLIRHFPAEGGGFRFEHNAHGAVTRQLDASGQTALTVEYDDSDRIVRVATAEDQVKSYTYDGDGNVASITTPDGGKWQYHWARNSKLIGEVSPEGNRYEYTYDTEDRLRQLINPKREIYHFSYDHLDRVTETRGFDGMVRRYEYDGPALGMMTEYPAAGSSGSPRITRYTHDEAGRINGKTLASGESHEYAYDEEDRLCQAETPQGKLAFEYDGLGNTISEDWNGANVVSEFDTLGRPTKRSSPAGNEIRYSYGEGNCLESITIQTNSGQSRTISYHRDGARTSIHYPGGVQSHYEMGSGGKLLSLETITSAGRQGAKYSYDALDHLVREDDLQKGTRRYRLDKEGRLLEAGGTGAFQRFEYDGHGNLTSKGDHQYHIGTGDRILSRNGHAYRYDGFGNLIERPHIGGRQRLCYDESNRLIRVENEQGETIASYSYDAIGRRISKVVGGVETRFAWDGEQLLSEETEGRLIEYIWDDFSLIAIIRDGDIYFSHNDRNGAPRALTDSFGREVWRGEYDVYGALMAHEGELRQPIRLPGQYHDEETGLHYNLHRFYDPDDGRFITQDPNRINSHTNSYFYVSNPLEYCDPHGLAMKGVKKLRTKYGNDPLSAAALSHRKDAIKNGDPISANRNVAVIEYTTQSGKSTMHIAGASGGGWHSEQHVWDALPNYVKENPNKYINKIYTELEPCDYFAKHGCGCWLRSDTKGLAGQAAGKGYTGPIEYHFTHNPGGTKRKEGKKAKRNAIKAAGGCT